MGQKNADAKQSEKCRGCLDHWEQSLRSRLSAHLFIQAGWFQDCFVGLEKWFCRNRSRETDPQV
jgi:hypothetical protein